MSTPSKQLGVLASRTSYTLQEFPVPEPGPGEVLIKNVAVASNPKDYKLPKDVPDYAFIEGNDVAGYIVKVGEGVTEYKGGERVAAFTIMRTKDNKYGGYAQYSVSPASTTFPIPENVSFEDASTLPLAVMTAAIGLFVTLGLPEPPAPDANEVFAPDNGKGLIVYGASSSVGAYVVQFAKRAGFYVVGVAGASADYVKELGADAVVDYRAHKEEGSLEAALISALNGRPTSAAYDAIAEHGSTLSLANTLAKTSPDGKGFVTHILPFNELEKLPKGIETKLTYVGSAHGVDEAFAERFYRQISKYLESSSTKPFQTNRVKLLPNGLAGVKDGIELLKSGRVHGEKLVYRIAETPGVSRV